MEDSPYQLYAQGLAQVAEIMFDELERWRNCEIEQICRAAQAQVQRRGKQLRPLLSLIVLDLLGGEQELVIAPAASVELCHLASLVLDDLQDNSELRRGAPTVHASSTASTAMNVALLLRSLSNHLIHRHPAQDETGMLRLHHELDCAATQLTMGQSVDIGWHEGWYTSFRRFPYLQMMEWKTGALFGCAAAMAACAAGAGLPTITAARGYGVSFGTFYQMINDYIDAFGEDTALRRPAHEDFREGKMTGPLIYLLSSLEDGGRERDIELILRRLADREAAADGWEWLLTLMDEHGVADRLRRELSDAADRLRRPSFGLVTCGSADALDQLVDMILAPAFTQPGTSRPGCPTGGA